MPKVTFIDVGGERRDVDAQNGLSILEIARQFGFDVEGRCEGSLACATCHVIVDPVHFPQLGEISEEEADMLDLAFNLKATSRLGCQILVNDKLDGLEVTLPPAGG
jgi:2Fe-2S ferredoxin